MLVATGCGWARRVLLTRRLRGPRPCAERRTLERPVRALERGRLGRRRSPELCERLRRCAAGACSGARTAGGVGPAERSSTRASTCWRSIRSGPRSSTRAPGPGCSRASMPGEAGFRPDLGRHQGSLGAAAAKAMSSRSWSTPPTAALSMPLRVPVPPLSARSASRSMVAGRGARSRHLRVSSVL